MVRYKFINTYVNCIDIEEVVRRVNVLIEKRVKTHIVFINAYKIYQISRDPQLAKAISEADFILADGVPIVWASRLLSIPIKGRVNGTDLFERLLYMASKLKKRVFLLGSTQKNIKLLVKELKKNYPGLIVSGFRNGYFNDTQNIEIINQINKSNADILFLGFGSPKKEIWPNQIKSYVNLPIIQGVGGSFDVLAGVLPRAPVWMQKNGLEWLFRLVQEPKRMFKRYLISNFVFLILFMKNVMRGSQNNSKVHK